MSLSYKEFRELVRQSFVEILDPTLTHTSECISYEDHIPEITSCDPLHVHCPYNSDLYLWVLRIKDDLLVSVESCTGELFHYWFSYQDGEYTLQSREESDKFAEELVALSRFNETCAS